METTPLDDVPEQAPLHPVKTQPRQWTEVNVTVVPSAVRLFGQDSEEVNRRSHGVTVVPWSREVVVHAEQNSRVAVRAWNITPASRGRCAIGCCDRGDR